MSTEPATEGELQATVALLAATAHPARLSVLLRLGAQGAQGAGELAEHTGLEASAMSHQLRILKEARLVTAHREGRRVIYELADHHVLHIVRDALAHVREHDAEAR